MANKLIPLKNNFRSWNLLNLKKKSQFFIKVIDGLFSIQRPDPYPCIWDKVLPRGHYLIVAQTTHLSWTKNFSFDNSIGRDICYNGKRIPRQQSPPEAYKQSHCIWDTHMTKSILSWIKFYKISIEVRIFFQTVNFQCTIIANGKPRW